jgi:hypothetical protein
MVWCPDTNQVTVDMTKVAGSNAKCWWWNPDDNTSVLIGTYATTGTRNFTPSSARKVLVLDNAASSLATPGETTTTTIPPSTCEILSIQPSGITIGFGLIPRIRTITVTLDVDLEAAGITVEDLNFENAPKGITILSAQISGNSIKAVVLFWSVTPGTYNLNLGPCGSIPFAISRF